MQLRMRREIGTHDAVNTRQFEHWQTDLPLQQGNSYTFSPLDPWNLPLYDPSGTAIDPNRRTLPVTLPPEYYDMAPLSSRSDKRDFRQSQPFIANAPQLAENPYFTRYDPTRDPRNAVRELRSVVYEDKDPERGVQESRRMLQRGFVSRWTEEGQESDAEKILLAYERMKPKLDNPAINFRATKPPK
jgi:hypothetical protein